MKKIGVAIFLATMMGFALIGRPAFALPSDFTANLATHTMSDVGAPYIGAQISGKIAVEQIWLVASDSVTAQTVDVYTACLTTAAATLKWRGYILPDKDVPSVFYLNYPLYNTPMYLTNPCFRKSSASSSVQVNVHYR